MTKHKIILLFFALLIISTEASLWEKLFSRRAQRERTIKEDLQEARNHAYKAWLETSKGAGDFKNAAWTGLYEAYESAWNTYQDIKSRISEGYSESLETAVRDYELAKEGVEDSAKKLSDFFTSYKDKAEEKTSDLFFSSLESLEEAASEARKKYGRARDVLAKLYDTAYDEAVDEYDAAAQYLSDATERLKNYAEYKTAKNYQETKKKLEDARLKARDTYRTSKKKAQDAKSKIDTFNTEISDYVQSYFNSVKERATEALDTLNTYENDVKAKANKNYKNILASLQKVSTRASNNVQEAELAMTYIKDRISKFATDSMETIRQKYLNLKDEL